MKKSASFENLTILDLSRYLPGGYATQFFADMGADVIKIEDTRQGDLCRVDPPYIGDLNYYITALARNKRSIGLNLKDSDALEAFKRLASDADIIVESFRPGVAKRLGIDYDSVKSVNERIIYCSFSGYGQDDPRSRKPLHDINMQAQSGYLSLNGGTKSPLHLCDLASSMVALQSLLAALFDREISGNGHYIDVAMFDSFVWWNSLVDSRWWFQGKSINPQTMAFPDDCCYYNVFDTADGGKLALGLIEDKFWDEFCQDVGCAGLCKESHESYETIRKVVASRTTAQWEKWLESRDLCIATVLDKDEALSRIMEQAPHLMRVCEYDGNHTVLQTNIPHKISGLDNELGTSHLAPRVGQDTEEILRKIGYDSRAISHMERNGACLCG